MGACHFTEVVEGLDGQWHDVHFNKGSRTVTDVRMREDGQFLMWAWVDPQSRLVNNGGRACDLLSDNRKK